MLCAASSWGMTAAIVRAGTWQRFAGRTCCACLVACLPSVCLLSLSLVQTIARRIPQVAYFTTLAIRFANNVVGGENFIDMARWAGVQ